MMMRRGALQLPTKADHTEGDQLVEEPDRSGPVPHSHPGQLILSTATTTTTSMMKLINRVYEGNRCAMR